MRTVAKVSGRRSFLRGAAGVTLALPFLESLPQRSAWAAGEEPVFSLFIGAVGGVLMERFFPAALGPLTSEGLLAANRATSELAPHAKELLLVSGVRYPSSGLDVHQDGLCMAFTGQKARAATEGDKCPGPSTCITANGRSADWEVCERTRPGTEPLVLYVGTRAYTSERLSYSAAGQVAPGILNPYDLYQQLVGLAHPDGSTTPETDAAAQRLLASRASIHDLVRDELGALLRHPRLASADRQRLQQHLDSVRDIESGFGGMATEAVDQCKSQGLDVTALEALKGATTLAERTEQFVSLHLSLVALAFACNYRRSASLQWGDAYDSTIYDVPANERRWTLSWISHRAQSDASTGNDTLAAQAHGQIDRVRMKTLSDGLSHFRERGLADRCVVVWTNQYGDGPYHDTSNVPHIIWGNPRGYLKQGQYINAGGVTNNKLLNTVLSASVQDTSQTVEDFGRGEGAGQLTALLA